MNNCAACGKTIEEDDLVILGDFSFHRNSCYPDNDLIGRLQKLAYRLEEEGWHVLANLVDSAAVQIKNPPEHVITQDAINDATLEVWDKFLSEVDLIKTKDGKEIPVSFVLAHELVSIVLKALGDKNGKV